MIKYNCNICDQINKEVMIHFTQNCCNKCKFCIDTTNKGIGHNKPDIDAIFAQVCNLSNKINELTISGGEPFLYMDELHELVTNIKTYLPNIKVYAITSLPKQCYDNQNFFFDIVDKLDGLIISVQHYDEKIADKIRGRKSHFDRNELYNLLANKYSDKISLNINLVKPYLQTAEDVDQTIMKFYMMGYDKFKVCEMFDMDDMYVSFEELFPNVKFNSPFAEGCNVKIDIKKLFPYYTFNLDINIKRSCFYRTHKQHASIKDIFKLLTRWMFAKNYSFGVIYEDGSLHPYWC